MEFGIAARGYKSFQVAERKRKKGKEGIPKKSYALHNRSGAGGISMSMCKNCGHGLIWHKQVINQNTFKCRKCWIDFNNGLISLGNICVNPEPLLLSEITKTESGGYENGNKKSI